MLNIGVLGLGFMGSTHLQAIERIPGLRLAAVMDMDERRLAGDLSGIAGNLGPGGKRMSFEGVRRYRDIGAILSDPDLDAVDICLPTDLHAPAAIQALRAGKHVLLEKPMALDCEGAAQILAAAEASGRILMVAQVLRFMSAYERLIEMVRGGKLGAIHSAFFRRRTAAPAWGPWEFDKSKSGGGVFDLLIHDVDMCLLLFGPPEAVSSTGHEDLAGGVDMISSSFHYARIGSVTITGGWHHRGQYPFSMEYTVAGERGVVEYSSAGRPPAVYWADGSMETLATGGEDPYEAEIAYFTECCRSGRQPERCRPAESAAAVRLTALMAEARERHGAAVPCSI
jgi:predicted dehydrogenase